MDPESAEWTKLEYECNCIACGKEDDPPKLYKCNKCDGPRFHDKCLPDACGVCQWCSNDRTYVFSAVQVGKARLFIEDLEFADPLDPGRKMRSLNLLEFHERSVPQELVSSPTKVPVESGVAEPPKSPSHSGETTSGGQPVPLDEQR